MNASTELALVPLLWVTPRHPSVERRFAPCQVAITTVDDVLALWLQRCDEALLDGARPLTPNARAAYGYSCASLSRELGGRLAGEIKALDVRRALASIAAGRVDELGRKRGGKSAACRDGHTLAAAYRYAIAVEAIPLRVLPTHPAEIVRAPRPNQRRDTHVPIETARAFFAAALELGEAGRISSSASRAIRLALLTGLRLRSDLLRLRVEHVDDVASMLRMRISKADEWMAIPISAEALALVRECEPVDGWLFPGRRSRGRITHLADVYRPWSLVLDVAAELGHAVTDRRGVRLVPHMMRHAFASASLGAGKSATNVSRVLGQTSSDSARLYESAGLAGMRDTVDAYAQQIRGENMAQVSGSIGHRIKARMGELEITQAQLSTRLAELGYEIGVNAIAAWLANRSTPTTNGLGALCTALDCSADWLLGRTSRG